ncbi:hypothetical protein ABT354_32050 [Streptomyces sp. NPDC000594]|uniref:hypothetical protein n=1 Tax=Streptomyces sp. NPDC000594 TaxID=3154261 RepID=UPI00332EA68E
MTAVVLSFTALTACGAGNNAESLGVKPDNPMVNVDTISVQNANVITQPKAGQAGPAVVSATIFNKGTKDQTVESITLKDGASVELKPAKGAGPLVVPAEGMVIIGGKDNATAMIADGTALTGNIGGVQEVVFNLSDTGAVKLDAFVVPAESYFKEYGPSAAPPAPKPAATASTSPSGEPSGTASQPAEGQPGAEGEPVESATQGTEGAVEGEQTEETDAAH